MEHTTLQIQDLELFDLIERETRRQQDEITLIPSENYASPAVREAVASALANKYAEGYAGRRYYEGNDIVDQVELLAVKRAKELFGVPYANVQPYSGSPANSEIFFALAEPGSTVMGLALSSGGHLTHGHPKVTFSGKYYKAVQFGLASDARIDYDQMASLAREHKPSIIIFGTTAYSFTLDWKRAREIADEVGAYLVADISHIIGLVITGDHPSPVPYAHVIMSTTHKTLRGPRGAIILVTEEGLQKDGDLPKKIDAAVMPGMQGGPHENAIAGIATSLLEATTDEFKQYSRQVILNAKALESELRAKGIELIGGGTENHLLVLDFSKQSLGKGTLVAAALNAAGIVANRNTVPSDTNPFYPSGVRVGTPAVTTRGMKEHEMQKVAGWIVEVVEIIKDEKLPEAKEQKQSYIAEFRARMQNDPRIHIIRNLVKDLCAQYPTP
ncbi:MAG: serine hydroxymethyltransferase [Candidatus Doudnabacteria bacterium]|nr:serine hydroxymethyltransferase [Candidatus Doudnabacteria bacterium]